MRYEMQEASIAAVNERYPSLREDLERLKLYKRKYLFY